MFPAEWRKRFGAHYQAGRPGAHPHSWEPDPYQEQTRDRTDNRLHCFRRILEDIPVIRDEHYCRGQLGFRRSAASSGPLSGSADAGGEQNNFRAGRAGFEAEFKEPS